MEDQSLNVNPAEADRRRSLTSSERPSPRAIAFYLPQFHPIPENDAWWGKGFTEWRSVASARPYFRGHHQPHIPAHLGFYDLRFEETRIVQAQLAREYLLSGFCYYHYWFNGKLLLERPFNEVLKSGRPDFPFCLCWANENWTRAWDGREREILISQRYDLASAGDHVRWLTRAFLDRRYIRIGDRPLILIYRTDILSDPKRVLEIWREVARREGIPDLYITAVRSNFSQVSEPELISIGFDAVVEFQPLFRTSAPFLSSGPLDIYKALLQKAPGTDRARTSGREPADLHAVFLCTTRPPRDVSGASEEPHSVPVCHSRLGQLRAPEGANSDPER